MKRQPTPRLKPRHVPVCEPLLVGCEKEYVNQTLDSNWISSYGSFISDFETSFSTYCDSKHGIAVTNGTAALHLALTALGIGHGDEVIIPDFTMIACAFAVCYTGALPVFVDAQEGTFNIDADKIEAKVTERTKAIMPVHIYGHPCDMSAIRTVAAKYGLLIIEDAAEAHGAVYDGCKSGSLGDIAAFSFFANKLATSGEGGMVVTDDDELAEKCRYYRNLCFPLSGERTYLHNNIGFNYRMSNVIAAIGLAQVQNLDSFVEKRRANHARYKQCLQNMDGLTLQVENPGVKNVYWMNGVVVDTDIFPINRDELMRRLKDLGVETRPFFVGMHRQPALKTYGCACDEEYPVAEMLSKNGLYLPSGSGLTDEDIEYVCQAIEGVSA